jgi:hypothetical protein
MIVYMLTVEVVIFLKLLQNFERIIPEIARFEEMQSVDHGHESVIVNFISNGSGNFFN